MRESRIVAETLVELSALPGVRVWRMNTGVGAGWGVIQQALQAARDRDIAAVLAILRRCRPVQFGIKGQADVTGVAPGGRRLEVELKTGKGKQRPEQATYEKVIRDHGGIYILARSAAEAKEKLMGEIERLANEECARLAKEVELLEDKVRWFEFASGRGDVRLTEADYDDAVSRGEWEPECEF